MGFWDVVGKASKAVGEFALDEAKQAKDQINVSPEFKAPLSCNT